MAKTPIRSHSSGIPSKNDKIWPKENANAYHTHIHVGRTRSAACQILPLSYSSPLNRSRRREHGPAIFSPMKQVPNPHAANFRRRVIVVRPSHPPNALSHRWRSLRRRGTWSSRGGGGDVRKDLPTRRLSSIPINFVPRCASSGSSSIIVVRGAGWHGWNAKFRRLRAARWGCGWGERSRGVVGKEDEAGGAGAGGGEGRFFGKWGDFRVLHVVGCGRGIG